MIQLEDSWISDTFRERQEPRPKKSVAPMALVIHTFGHPSYVAFFPRNLVKSLVKSKKSRNFQGPAAADAELPWTQW